MSDVIRFTNGYLALADGTAVQADLYISPATGLILSGQNSFYHSLLPPARTVDLGGNILSPGLIDVQINGAYGIDFSELDLEDPKGEEKYVQGLEQVAKRIVETGCTSFLPTIITQKEELYAKLLRLLRPRSGEGSANILGYHAEGPFLHPARKGAHSQTLLMTATPNNGGSKDFKPIQVFDKVYGKEGLDQEGVKLITLAPDVEGAMDCIEELTKRGVTVSIGHSDATLETATEAVAKGSRMITHLFNAMPPIHHRDPGVIGLLGAPSNRPYYGIIADGLHSHPNTVRIAYGAHKEGCILVTDAQSPMDPNLPDGVHNWRPGVKFRKEGYKVTIDGTNTLAGSCAPLPVLISNLSHFARIPLPESILAATLRPAIMLGNPISKSKGQLEVGFDADLCVFAWDGSCRSTWVAGKEVWRDSRYSTSAEKKSLVKGWEYLGPLEGEQGAPSDLGEVRKAGTEGNVGAGVVGEAKVGKDVVKGA